MQPQNSRRPAGTGSLRVRNDVHGNGTWYASFRDATGKQKQVRIAPVRVKGSPIGLSRREAEEALRQRMGTERHSDDRVLPSTVPLTVESIGELVQERQRIAGRQATTIGAFGINVRRHLVPFFGDVGLDQIARRDVERLIVHLLDKGLSPKTVNNVRGDLAAIFNYAIREDWITRNPVVGSVRPVDPAGDGELRFLTVEQVFELARLGPTDDELGREVEGDLYVTAAMTGARQGELLALRWCDVDFEASAVRIWRKVLNAQFGPTKGKDRRTVPLGGHVLDVLVRRAERLDPEPHDLVFGDPITGGPISRHRITGQRFAKACERAGVPIIVFHELRHTFGTQLAAAGVAPIRIQTWMGHKDFATTSKYLHHAPADKDASEITRAFDRAFVPEPADDLAE